MSKTEWTRRRTEYMRRWRASMSPEKREAWLASRRKGAPKHPRPAAPPNAKYENHKRWVAKNPGVMRQDMAEERVRLKADVLAAYGSVCACCGEDEPVFLTIDHIIPARRTPEQRRQTFHRQLRIEGYPPGYQVLCFNCNCAKRTNPECPHRLLVRRKLVLVEPRNL